MAKEKFLIIDTETANGLDNALVYDCGFLVTDKTGHIYEEGSYIIYDIFVNEKELMQSAYYAEKIPNYEKDLKAKERKMITFFTLKKTIAEVIAKYNIKKVFAYNALFDKNSLNTTQRYLTKSKFRWFFPYGIQLCCIWSIACQTICQQKSFFKFIKENDYFQKHRVKTSAEVVYQYITKNNNFIESHTALEDVYIEKDILLKCFAQKKKIDYTVKKFPTHEVNRKYKEWVLI